MKKYNVQKKPNARLKSDSNIATAVKNTSLIGRPASPVPESPAHEGSALMRWLVLVGMVAVAGLALAWLPWSEEEPSGRQPRPGKAARERWRPEVWQPQTNDESIVDRFVQLRNVKNQAAFDLLGPPPVFDEKPVSESEAEKRQTDFFLRGNLRFVDVWRGEPDGNGGQRAAPGRFTLVTKGNISSPRMRIQTADGVEPPSQEHLNNPDLIIEVRAGTIHGLTHMLHKGP